MLSYFNKVSCTEMHQLTILVAFVLTLAKSWKSSLKSEDIGVSQISPKC